MRAIQQKANAGRARTCRSCRKAIRVGQWFIETVMPANYTEQSRYHVVHASCMRTLLASIPEDDDKQADAFNELKQRIATTGYAFPELTGA